nr:MAG TPA: hypothetical protein [Caudoviricetes sp.]
MPKSDFNSFYQGSAYSKFDSVLSGSLFSGPFFIFER